MMILDMSGHGIGAALRAISLSNLFQEDSVRFQFRSVDPGRILSKLNEDYPLTDQGEYFTIWLGVYQWSTRVLRYATAGHPGGILIRKDESGSVLGTKSWPIGFCPGEAFETQEMMTQPGDRLYLFSDGIYEVLNNQEEIWGQERLQRTLEKQRGRSMRFSLQTVVQESQLWQQKMTFADDVAVVGLEFH